MKEIWKSKEKLIMTWIPHLTLMQLQCDSTMSRSLGYSPPQWNPIWRHGRNNYSGYRKYFLVSSSSMKLKSIIKTLKMTNTRGHKFTSITQTLNMRCQHCDNYYSTIVSIFIYLSLLYCKRRWSIMIPQVQKYSLWVKYLFKHWNASFSTSQPLIRHILA